MAASVEKAFNKVQHFFREKNPGKLGIEATQPYKINLKHDVTDLELILSYIGKS